MSLLQTVNTLALRSERMKYATATRARFMQMPVIYDHIIITTIKSKGDTQYKPVCYQQIEIYGMTIFICFTLHGAYS